MKISNEQLEKGIERISDLAERRKLPSWAELPNIELYMDQAVTLVNRYLGFYAASEEDSPIITSSMINNYVKLKVIPTPVKKRYNRVHLACLIMIGTLKQSLSIPTIEVMLPNDCDEQSAEQIYEKFVESWDNSLTMASEMVEEQLKSFAECRKYQDIFDLASDMAVSSNIFKVFTEKLIGIDQMREKSDDKQKAKESKKSDKADKKAAADG